MRVASSPVPRLFLTHTVGRQLSVEAIIRALYTAILLVSSQGHPAWSGLKFSLVSTCQIMCPIYPDRLPFLIFTKAL